MQWIDQAIRLIDIVVWPVTMLLVIWFVRKQIPLALQLVRRIKYKDVEIEFSERLAQIKEEVGETSFLESSDSAEDTTLLALAQISPASAIIEVWKKLETSATKKVRELAKNDETYKDPSARPIEYLEYTGALIPSSANAWRNLRSLRNIASHSDATDISREDAIQYAAVANRIRNQIESITELPAVKLTALTLLILELNHLIDTKKYDDIKINEVYKWIDDENIIPSLADRAANDADLSLYGEEGPYSNFAKFYHQKMKAIADGYAGDHRRKWGVENLGLCLLLAWTNELIQQGSGWYPNEM